MGSIKKLHSIYAPVCPRSCSISICRCRLSSPCWSLWIRCRMDASISRQRHYCPPLTEWLKLWEKDLLSGEKKTIKHLRSTIRPDCSQRSQRLWLAGQRSLCPSCQACNMSDSCCQQHRPSAHSVLTQTLPSRWDTPTHPHALVFPIFLNGSIFSHHMFTL